MKVIKKNYKLFLGIIVGIIVSSILCVYASGVVAGNISYKNVKLKSTNIQDTIDEINQKITSKGDNCPNYNYSNTNFIKGYSYNETGSNLCITGNESTCKETTCYRSGICKAGDIIDYKVNDSETIRFHVMFDDCGTLTMQSQKNTVYHVSWYNESDISNGPYTILSKLETETNDWSNVNDLTYSLGTTVFKKNSYTGCNPYNSCAINDYTLDNRTGKSRMLSLQEATVLGCTHVSQSCPVWMYNYLYNSISNGGTADDPSYYLNLAYWTVSTVRYYSNLAWYIDNGGKILYGNVSYSHYGARAVVEVSK